jgi:hypothetical protein
MANGIFNSEKSENAKGHYEFLLWRFQGCPPLWLLAAESRAGQYRHYEIENAAAHLHGMLEGRNAASAPKR